MKLTITHLKAPWPAGAKVGDVIDLLAVPVWAVGKCEPSPEDAEVTVAMPEAPAPAESAGHDPLAELRAQAEAHFERMKAEHAAELAELQAKLDGVTAERDALASELIAARAEFAEGKGSEALPGAFDREAAEAEAKSLGVSFNARTADDVLAERIAAAKAG